MWALALSLALSATPRHLAVASADSDAAVGDLERAVRDALRAALPRDTVQTHDDVMRDALARVDLAHPTEEQAKAVCDVACAYGRDGLVTAQRLDLGGHSRLRVAFYHPGDPSPVADAVVPLDRNDRSATDAVKQLLGKL